MRKNVRDAIAAVYRHGAELVEVAEGGRHTEIVFEVAGRRGVLRLHRGGNSSPRVVPAIRSAIRRVAAGGETFPLTRPPG